MATAKSLAEVLLDKTARWDERDNAAMDLRKYDDDEGLRALIQVACSPEDDLILDSCGESIEEIWVRRGIYDLSTLNRMTAYAQKSALAVLRYNRKDWEEQLASFLEKDSN